MGLLCKIFQLLFLDHHLLLLNFGAGFVFKAILEFCVLVKEVLQHKFNDHVEEEFADQRLLEVDRLEDGKDKVLDDC